MLFQKPSFFHFGETKWQRNLRILQQLYPNLADMMSKKTLPIDEQLHLYLTTLLHVMTGHYKLAETTRHQLSQDLRFHDINQYLALEIAIYTGALDQARELYSHIESTTKSGEIQTICGLYETYVTQNFKQAAIHLEKASRYLHKEALFVDEKNYRLKQLEQMAFIISIGEQI